MKTTPFVLLAAGLGIGWQGGAQFANAPHFTDERAVKQHWQQLRRQGVTQFAVYQLSVPTVGPGSPADNSLTFGREVTYCVWKAGAQEYARKYTDSTTYEPVVLPSKVFGFPDYATTGVTRREREQPKFIPPVTEPGIAPRQREVVIFSAGSQLRYFETKDQVTYIADPLRQRRREQWAARLQAAAAQAEAQFGKPLPYHRPQPGEAE
ncbi:hypothetical protein EJV47_22415 [Hymenobacter gummosus]|uniref:Uncharacterized protein n=1 Tax=Hymenobacter gummosus TaxID=1776032 RepID=A0A431TX24_9BACT|nr:hypothetical protein [Hymenobacter gummosus]RTQ46283.1 hypothetical protein EJV47_22415 [Hymenobacter gummosus]